MGNRIFRKGILTYLALSFIAPCAMATTFMAPHDKSHWETSKSKLVCKLSHEIPGYGQGIFEQRAGMRQTFALHATMGRLLQGDISISKAKPSWATQQRPIHLANVSAKMGLTPLKLKKMTVYQLLDGLDKGYQSQFDFQPSNTSTDVYAYTRDKIVLSPIGFHNAYQDYVACIEDLVPYSFDEIKESTIRFETGSKALSYETKQKLIHIGEFASHDPNVYKVLIEGHTDSVGSFTANRRLSYERAWYIKDILVDEGVNPDIIEVKGMADRKPIAKNSTKEGRKLNRRVEVKLYR